MLFSNGNTVTKLNDIPWWTLKLHEPDLEKLAVVLANGLRKNFEKVTVDVTMCPNLTSKPFNLAAAGLCGDTAIMDIGGPTYVLPFPRTEKWWDIQNLLTQSHRNRDSFVIGSGLASQPFMPYNSELIMNATFALRGVATTKVLKNASRVAFVDRNTEQCRLQSIDHTGCSMEGNFFISDGKPGNVLRVYAKKRIGQSSFTETMQKTLANHYDEIIGLGGTFVARNGKLLQYVTPQDFPQSLLTLNTETQNWFHWYNMQTPMTAIGTLVNKDAYLQKALPYTYTIYLTPKHFHTFSEEFGGHYCNDGTPDTIEYLGYFNVASKLHRVDQARPSSVYSH